MPALCTYNLTVGYPGLAVMSGISVQLSGGRLTALIGPNGIGKSTLLRTLAAAQPPLAGEITIGGMPIAQMGRRQLARTLAMVFTDRAGAGGLTVRQVVSLGRQPHTGFLGRLSRSDRNAVDEAAQAVGIAHKLDSYMSELSDGERQKAMIARALAQGTPIIILDEPTAFLDAASRIETLQLLSRLARARHKAILLSTHDISATLPLADQLWLASTDGITAGCTEDLILAGALDGVFGHTARFDPLKGDFQALPPATRAASVDCPDPALRHCLATALRRNGIAPAQPGSPAEIRISAQSPASIILNGERAASSISQLCDWLSHTEE